MEDPARIYPSNDEPRIRLISGTPAAEPSVDSYRRLADVFHDLLSEQSLDSLLVRIEPVKAEKRGSRGGPSESRALDRRGA